MKKRGQVYLVSAIIIAAIIISIVAVSNYSNKNEYLDLNSLRDQLNIEGGRVLDYGINNGLSQAQMNQYLIDFTQRYIDTESTNKNLYFIFGNQDNITLKGYQYIAHSVLLQGSQVTSSSGAFFSSINPLGITSITMKIDENTYGFTLKSGENLFFVISRDVGGKSYVVTG